jgi:hypothetical protein
MPAVRSEQLKMAGFYNGGVQIVSLKFHCCKFEPKLVFDTVIDKAFSVFNRVNFSGQY